MEIIFQEVSKSFGEKKVLDRFSIAFPKGISCLFGPSGCGKTTVLNLISGIFQPEAGCVNRGEHSKVSYVFQKPRLLPWETCKSNISLVMPKTNGDDDSKRRDRKVLEMMEYLELADEAQRYPHELSGGMQQRVSIARALCHNGNILLLDEPFTGLDAALTEKISALIRTHAPLHTVLVTHDERQAKSLSDRIYHVKGLPLQIKGIVTK